MLFVVYDLKRVEPLVFKLVVPMPEPIKTTTMHFYGYNREILLARIRNPIFVQACLKEKVPVNIKNTTEITRILSLDPG